MTYELVDLIADGPDAGNTDQVLATGTWAKLERMRDGFLSDSADDWDTFGQDWVPMMIRPAS